MLEARQPHILSLHRPVEQRIVLSLYTVIDGCLELFRKHGEDCDCQLCEDAVGLFYQARMFTSILESQIVSFPEMKTRINGIPREQARK
jgi:hypothetical protein